MLNQKATVHELKLQSTNAQFANERIRMQRRYAKLRQTYRKLQVSLLLSMAANLFAVLGLFVALLL